MPEKKLPYERDLGDYARKKLPSENRLGFMNVAIR